MELKPLVGPVRQGLRQISKELGDQFRDGMLERVEQGSLTDQDCRRHHRLGERPVHFSKVDFEKKAKAFTR